MKNEETKKPFAILGGRQRADIEQKCAKGAKNTSYQRTFAIFAAFCSNPLYREPVDA
jgi:hypothetical protein